MIFILTDEQKQYCRTIGIPIPPDSIETDEEEYERNVSHWRTSLPDANEAAIHLKVIGRLAWKRHLAKRQTEKPESPSVQTSPQIHIHHADTWLLWAWRIAVLGLLCLIATHAHAQFSHVNSIQFEQGGSPITGGFYTYPFVFNCAGALTCTVSGNTVTATGGAGGSTSWDAITNPAGNLALSMAHYTTVLTYDATTGANAIMFRLTDTLNNTGTGPIFQVDTASGSAAPVVKFCATGTTICVAMDSTGNFAPASTAKIGGLTSTVFGYLANVTSDVQTQLNAKVPSTRSISTTAPLGGGGDLSADRTLTCTGCLTANQTVTLSGDVTGSGATAITTVLANIPSATPMAGSLLATAIAAPSTPASGKGSLYVDSTSKNIAVKDDAGVVKHGVQTDTGTANNYISAISDAGGITKSRPACATLSDAAATCNTATAAAVGLGSVTNDAQTKAAIVPNTAPSAGQILAGNAGGTAYAPVSVSGDATLASTGAVAVVKVNGASVPASAAVAGTNSSNQVVAATANNISTPLFCSDAGANDTYACNLSPAIASYVTGTHYRFKANTANTGAASINLNSVGAITIVKVAGGITTTLADNDIRAGQWVDVVYDGTNMQMQSTLGNAASGGGSVTVNGQTCTIGGSCNVGSIVELGTGAGSNTFASGLTYWLNALGANGGDPTGLSTQGAGAFVAPANLTITSAYCTFYNNNGTAGVVSAGTVAFGISINGAAATSISTDNTILTQAARATKQISTTGLSISATAGQTIEMKLVTPTFSTAPTGQHDGCHLYVQVTS